MLRTHLFFLLFTSSLHLGRRLVSFVQTCNYVFCDVVHLVGIQNVIASLAQDKRKLLALVVACKEVLNAVAQSLVILFGLVLELATQTLVQGLQIGVLTLQLSLNSLSLLTSICVLLNFLLEIGGSGL